MEETPIKIVEFCHANSNTELYYSRVQDFFKCVLGIEWLPTNERLTLSGSFKT